MTYVQYSTKGKTTDSKLEQILVVFAVHYFYYVNSNLIVQIVHNWLQLIILTSLKPPKARGPAVASDGLLQYFTHQRAVSTWIHKG